MALNNENLNVIKFLRSRAPNEAAVINNARNYIRDERFHNILTNWLHHYRHTPHPTDNEVMRRYIRLTDNKVMRRDINIFLKDNEFRNQVSNWMNDN